jgi:hypothetical protein
MTERSKEWLAGAAAERERIAAWHETQASKLELAIERILAEGGTIEISNKTMAELHRSFAAAIRAGAE